MQKESEKFCLKIQAINLPERRKVEVYATPRIGNGKRRIIPNQKHKGGLESQNWGRTKIKNPKIQ
jgi:hypothetical protein